MKRFKGQLLGISALLLFLACGGFIKLNIPTQAYQAENGIWLTAYGNYQRHNAARADILPPYQTKWSRGLPTVIPDNPLAMDNYILCPLKNGTVAFLEIQHGDKIADGHMVPAFEHAPTLFYNNLYYTAILGDKPLGVFDLGTTQRLWEKKVPHLTSSPIVNHQRIVVAWQRGGLAAFHPRSGEKLWEFKIDEEIPGNIAATEKTVFAATTSGTVLAVEAKSGKLIWQKKFPAAFFSGPVIAEGLLLIGNIGGQVMALNAENGELLWQKKLDGAVYCNAAADSQMAIFASNDFKITALELRKGRKLWEFATGGLVSAPPLLGPTLVYIGSWDKHLYVLDKITGKLIFRQKFKHAIKTAPVIYKDMLLVSVANHRIFALVHAKEGENKNED